MVIATAKSNQYSNIKKFFDATTEEPYFNLEGKADWNNNIVFKEYSYSSMTRQYLEKFVGYNPNDSASTILLNSEWDEQDILINLTDLFVTIGKHLHD